MITLNDYATASGKYPERLKDPEFNQEVKDNATKLLDKVNSLLKDLGVDKSSVSSGFRPSSVNGAIKNAAKKSSHMTGKAVDLVDSDGKLDTLVASKPDLLRKYGLFQEAPSATVGWCHLDCAERSDRPSRQFIP